MRRLGGLLVGLGGLFTWHVLTGWQPPLTDGIVWRPSSDCKWVAQSKLPTLSENAVEIGDTLLRVDYQPACKLSHIPPAERHQQLFLYEISRQGETHLIFVESIAPFVLGWPESELSYRWTTNLTLTVLLGGIVLLLFIAEKGSPQRTPSQLAALVMTLFLFGSLWLLWAGKGLYDRALLGQISLAFWGSWTLLRGSAPRHLPLLLPLVGLPFLIQGPARYFLAEAIIGSLALWLPKRIALLYAALWGVWVGLRGPILLPLLGMVGILEYLPWVQRAFQLLPPGVMALRLLIVPAGLGVALLGQNPLAQLLLGAAGLGASLLFIETIRRLLQSQQRRVRLLQERLPRLWERIEKADLIRFAEETLQAYASISQIAILKAPDSVPERQRPWIQRMGEPAPFPLEKISFLPDVALPLPAYGWLCLKEGTYRLRLEDIQRLLPFAAGLSIALRHAELFEAAHEARLAALRGQLSPHFLFNALNTLQSLVGENPSLAESLMSRLGTLLRRSLSHARQVVVPLEEELSLVQDYLEIEQQRFGQRLRIKWNVSQPCPIASIPPFAIQLLAENVIKHAVGRVTRPVQMEIEVREEGGQVIIRVSDDGPGIELDRIGQGVGLSNLITRLKQLYGEQATLIAERLNPGTRISMILSRRYPERDARTHNLAEGLSAHER
ncbi:MAG: histidine kinase [Bacteroidia bacterium]|nr:histidine kinase [Bacteroidia bacterium]